MKVFASHNPNDETRKNSSAGGVFTTLAELVLRKGGVIYGVTFDDNWNIVHQREEKEDNIHRFRGSKYAYSHIGDSLRNVVSDLNDGRIVLFSGTPCQIAAIRKKIGDNKNLITVEVVCHGAPKHEYWEKYLTAICQKFDKTRDDISKISFRDKRTGWAGYSFTIDFKDGTLFSERGSKNLYMKAFLSDYTLKDGCFKCPFKYPDGSKADITLGDLWGIKKLAPEIYNDSGSTLVIARTAIGEQYTELLSNDCELTLDAVAHYNPAIIRHASAPKNRGRFLEEFKSGCDVLSIFDKFTKPTLRNRLKLKFFAAIRYLKTTR
ncbi:MAG: Coenzyme F420 hydrogenase/dehydrogenase, beta subunit C-terminal domain [Muribaculaceae bacterium]|nr:Coenzyme F420 hydrogenase/dehydrogenase, beta subunit C-terminal domain [Muribaculaceae bacterium]